MKVPYWQVDLGEDIPLLVKSVAEQRSFSMGRYCEEFETTLVDLLGVKYAIGVSSGSDAILISLMALGIGRGDKVLVQDRSWIAAANAIAILGAIPIYVDVRADSPVISVTDLIDKFTPDCKALVVVHMNGRHGEFLKVLQFCKMNYLPMIEDAAQALGSKIKNQPLGTFGEIGCFSLSIAKIVGSGQGGFCVTNSQPLGNKISLMRIHGTADPFAAKWESIGFNFRLTDFHAAIANNQIKYLAERIQRANEVMNLYREGLKDSSHISLIELDFPSGEVGPYVEATVTKSREKLIEFAKFRNVEIRPFYPSTSQAKYLGGFGSTPNADMYAKTGIYLPSGPAISNKQVAYVCEVVQDFFNEFEN
ncbi:WecE Predicted pyridoxal phosphate-dependent enzyme apparently involved in regulation of cell wall biogenesis [Candidatus Nanopelagicaceae bacterium]